VESAFATSGDADCSSILASFSSSFAALRCFLLDFFFLSSGDLLPEVPFSFSKSRVVMVVSRLVLVPRSRSPSVSASSPLVMAPNAGIAPR